MFTLGIDTTADDTCAAIVVGGHKILSNTIFSQSKLHEKYGGIVPQIASREHLKNIIPVIDVSLKEADLKLSDIDLISVGQSPDKALSYYHVGITTAKMFSYVLGIPLVGVDHMEAHVFANLAIFPDIQFPFISLTASGGHTLLTKVSDFGDYRILGSTLDDAAGEAFDKVARLLGLTYPGGPSIDKAAIGGDSKAYKFPRPMKGHKGYDFSYSGLKTSVYLKVRELLSERRLLDDFKESPSKGLTEKEIRDLAASFRAAVIDSLLIKTFRAVEEFGVERLVLGGGVAANELIRSEAEEKGNSLGVRVYYPPRPLCTDNAVGIATLGYYQYKKKGPDDIFKLSYFRKSPLEPW